MLATISARTDHVVSVRSRGHTRIEGSERARAARSPNVPVLKAGLRRGGLAPYQVMQEAGRERNPDVDLMGLVTALLDPVARRARRLALDGDEGWAELA